MSALKSKSQAAVIDDPMRVARSAGLRYTTDHSPGYQRRRQGRGFVYLDADNSPVVDRDELRRIKSLVIPPAWKEVWISAIANGHLQATGRDSKGRKQYRYHERWRKVRDETKYARLIQFAGQLPRIRKQVWKDMGLRGLPKRKVLATIVRLLETTLIRVGNEEYARSNNSFGLTTLRNRHAEVSGQSLRFEFRGKGGKSHVVCMRDRRVAAIVRRCQDLPGRELFQYLDENGARQTVDSGDVNQYLKDITQEDFTAKDYRTWAGTLLAALALKELEAFDSHTQAKRNIVRAIETVASRLGNTPTICRKCYVHPVVIDSYLDGTMLQTLKGRAEQEMTKSLRGLRSEESAVLALLQQRLLRGIDDLRKAG